MADGLVQFENKTHGRTAYGIQHVEVISGCNTGLCFMLCVQLLVKERTTSMQADAEL